MNTEFAEFLIKKKIDPDAFRESEPDLFKSLEEFFAKTGPVSFDQQKKFLFNPLRTRHLIKEQNN